ncbi:FHA domain-containing protein [Dyella mobilis]|uniref:FHA domain-containing protein n=1 Tax=Dyella mobilis TaxID=1849582 RepID=A0ABS2KAT8_9GAMM|nr:FHA domain-containing protein [Dyella mobilis]MBM7128301.1 FHA domain-containing protein [Dyella mobilis]GLQ99862.1 phosphopeptide-binding protein [Dyella mobilis]
MAIVHHGATKEWCVLKANHVFGRHVDRTDTVLASADISQIHAAIGWRGDRWQIIDYSRNGTLLSGRRLPAGVWTDLQIEQHIRFSANELSDWTVIDLTPPGPVLVPRDEADTAPLPLKTWNQLPDPHRPSTSIYQGLDGCWWLECGEDSIHLHNGQHITIADRSWRFLQRDVDIATLQASSSDQLPLHLHFRVSLDEEHVNLTLSTRDRTLDLGERSHHYLLATLARKRLADKQAGIDPLEQGWIGMDRLSRMLGMDPPHLNIQVYRARNQLVSALREHAFAPLIIERRRGDVRLGALAYDIARGSKLEGSYSPAAMQ